MKLRFLITILSAVLCVAGCSQKKDPAAALAAKEKTWKAERRIKAIRFYREVEKNYPDSPYASQASERLSAMALTTAERAAADAPVRRP